ncbi:hypothetical protein DFJ74DRAFT_655602 [Hyaloraphidium curvatum]|nr:hypothetical protein DFJ74DRAFT_655602 [Hyaloraphidium curvatum]
MLRLGLLLALALAAFVAFGAHHPPERPPRVPDALGLAFVPDTAPAPKPALPPALLFSAVGDLAGEWPFLDVDAAVAHVALAYYGNSPERFEQLKSDPRVRTAFRARGTKFQLLWAFSIFSRDLISSYKWLAAFDDDIPLSAGNVSKLLADVAAHGASHPTAAVYSPAHDRRGRVSYGQLLPQGCACHCSPTKGSCDGLPAELRKVPFVEMTWPIFSSQFALDFMDSYSPMLPGWGADVWFSFLAKERGLEMYVVDSMPARNPKPEDKGFEEGKEKGEMRELYPYRAWIFDIIRQNPTVAARIPGTIEEHNAVQKQMRVWGYCCGRKNVTAASKEGGPNVATAPAPMSIARRAA